EDGIRDFHVTGVQTCALPIWQQARACGRPYDGEAGQSERDRRGTRPLADDDVDPEVLHREVEHLLDRPGEPVDLVDEEDVVLLESGRASCRGRGHNWGEGVCT